MGVAFRLDAEVADVFRLIGRRFHRADRPAGSGVGLATELARQYNVMMLIAALGNFGDTILIILE